MVVDYIRKHDVQRNAQLLGAMNMSKARRICEYDVCNERLLVDPGVLSCFDARSPAIL